MKNNKLKNWSVGIFHFTFGQFVYRARKGELRGKLERIRLR